MAKKSKDVMSLFSEESDKKLNKLKEKGKKALKDLKEMNQKDAKAHLSDANNSFLTLVGALSEMQDEKVENSKNATQFTVGETLKHKTKGYLVKVVPANFAAHEYMASLSPVKAKDYPELLEDVYILNPHFKGRDPLFSNNVKFKTERMNLDFYVISTMFEKVE